MADIDKLLVDLQRTQGAGGSIALSVSLKEATPLFAILLIRGNQVVDVLATGRTPEDACRAAAGDVAAAVR